MNLPMQQNHSHQVSGRSATVTLPGLSTLTSAHICHIHPSLPSPPSPVPVLPAHPPPPAGQPNGAGHPNPTQVVRQGKAWRAVSWRQHYIWGEGLSSISIRKVSMGVSPISLKKKRCSRHLSPMERRAGRRRRSLAKRPGSSGLRALQYSSSEAYTFSRSCSTFSTAVRFLASVARQANVKTDLCLFLFSWW